MFSTASIAPAPKPRNRVKKNIIYMFFEIEKPNRPTAVSAVLTAAIFDVENFSVSFALIRLEIIEHTVIVTVTAFAAEIGRPKSLLIAGHAAPKSESGIPSPMKSIKITIKSKVAIIYLIIKFVVIASDCMPHAVSAVTETVYSPLSNLPSLRCSVFSTVAE